MADFLGIVENLSDLAHELKSGFGTVLTILGSHLESSARSRVDASAVCAGCGHVRVDHWQGGPCGHRDGVERVPCDCRRFLESVGPQWLTEFEAERDSLDPDEQLFECSAPTCGCHDDPRYQAFPAPEDSAAVSAAADPSPAPLYLGEQSRGVGDEGPGGASDIPQSAPPGQPSCQCGHPATCMYPVHPVPPVVAGESPREEVEQPSLGEPRRDSELMQIAATAIETVTEAWTGAKRAKWAVDLIAELRARACEFEVFEREAAGE